MIRSLVPGVRWVRQSPVHAGQGLSVVRRLRPIPMPLHTVCEGAVRDGRLIGHAAGTRGAAARPSVFQAGHIPSRYGTCECRWVLPTACACRWLLLLLSPLLSAHRVCSFLGSVAVDQVVTVEPGCGLSPLAAGVTARRSRSRSHAHEGAVDAVAASRAIGNGKDGLAQLRQRAADRDRSAAAVQPWQQILFPGTPDRPRRALAPVAAARGTASCPMLRRSWSRPPRWPQERRGRAE